jgi:hypothetical protein
LKLRQACQRHCTHLAQTTNRPGDIDRLRGIQILSLFSRPTCFIASIHSAPKSYSSEGIDQESDSLARSCPAGLHRPWDSHRRPHDHGTLRSHLIRTLDLLRASSAFVCDRHDHSTCKERRIPRRHLTGHHASTFDGSHLLRVISAEAGRGSTSRPSTASVRNFAVSEIRLRRPKRSAKGTPSPAMRRPIPSEQDVRGPFATEAESRGEVSMEVCSQNGTYASDDAHVSAQVELRSRNRDILFSACVPVVAHPTFCRQKVRLWKRELGTREVNLPIPYHKGSRHRGCAGLEAGIDCVRLGCRGSLRVVGSEVLSQSEKRA